jgi:enterochelin esterase family protein
MFAALVLAFTGATARGQASGSIRNVDLSPGGASQDKHFDSPRLRALVKQLSASKSGDSRAVIESFWRETQGRCPLVESIEGEKRFSWITYLWRGDEDTRSVSLSGGPTSASGDSVKWLTRLEGTDIWYLTERIPNDARFIYSFQINRPTVLPADLSVRGTLLFDLAKADPLNPHGAGPRASLVELPGAPPQPWLERKPGVPEGQLSGAQVIKSTILGQDRTIKVLVPAGYDSAQKARGLLIMFDGEACLPVYEIILDNLAAEKKVQNLVTVFVYQTADRDRELACSEPFAGFVALELVPWMRTNYHVSSEAAQTIVCGASRGGLMAGYCGYLHPDVFGNVLSISGSFWWYPGADDPNPPPDGEPGWLIRQYVTSRAAGTRFFLSAGRFENGFPMSLLGENRRLRDVLLAKGCSVEYREYSSGHHPYCWHNPFVDGLTALTATERTNQKKR